MSKAIGPTFADELKAAGLLGLPFSWGPDGIINDNDPRLTQAQRDAIQAVYAAHDPTKPAPAPPPPPPSGSGDTFLAGIGAPSSDVGNANDIYLDIATGDVHQKA